MNKPKFIKCSNGHVLGELRQNGIFVSKHRRRELTVRAVGTIALKCGQCGEKLTITVNYKPKGDTK